MNDAGPRPPWRVLVFPHGTEIANEILAAIGHNKAFRIELATSDEALLVPGEAAAHALPFVDDDRFEPALRELVASHGIDAIVPAHDDVALALSRMQDLPCKVIGQSRATNEIVRFKDVTYRELAGTVPVPRVFADPADFEFPVFAKPRRGQGSHGTARLDTPADYDHFVRVNDVSRYLFTEFLPGEEYTVDCFSHAGELLFAGPRTRDRTINGIASRSRSLRSGETHEILQGYAAAITRRLAMHGLWFFQAKRSAGGKLVLLEVGPRVSGTMMVNRARGVNFVELALWQAFGREVTVEANDLDVAVWRTLQPRYRTSARFDRLFVDFDDTLLVAEERLAPSVMALIVSAKNAGKPVFLITRNWKRNLAPVLHRFGIGAMFDGIIHLQEDEPKSPHLRAGDLLIDDSHAERRQARLAGCLAIAPDLADVFV